MTELSPMASVAIRGDQGSMPEEHTTRGDQGAHYNAIRGD